MADPYMTPTVSLSVVLGFLALVFLSGSYWKEVEIANRIPITVKMNAVVVIVLTIWNFTAAIRFGRPFGQGHTVDGFVRLCSGTVLNITIFAYQAYYRSEADRKVGLLCQFGALYLESWGLVGTVVDIVALGLNEGNRWCLALGVISLVYSLFMFVCEWAPWKRRASWRRRVGMAIAAEEEGGLWELM
jgi:hypothetical protein